MRLKTAVIFCGFLLAVIFPVVAQASSTDNVSGWAWSDTIGWVSFNSTDISSSCYTTQSPYCYGVTINPSTGVLSGYAWSDNVGWISFNSTHTGGCPVAPCQAQLVLTGNYFQGWARAVAAIGRTDGWDGWISLKGSNYGVTLNGSALQSFAWGDAVVGWLQFNPTYGGVFYNASGGVNIQRVRQSGSSLVNLDGTTAVLDGVSVATNPAIYFPRSNGTYSAGVMQDSRGLTAATCTYVVGGAECNVSDPNAFNLTPTCTSGVCSVPISVTSNLMTKVIFKYTNAMGDVLVKRITTSDDPSTAPEGTIATMDGANAISTNPAIYRNVSGSHTYGSSNVTGYTVTVGSCTYTIPATGTENNPDTPPTGCPVSSFGAPTFVNGVPTYTDSVDPGKVRKIVFKYTADSGGGGVSCQAENPAQPGVKIASSPAGQPVRWAAVGGLPTSNYIWKDSVGNTIASGVGLTSITRTYTVIGSKSVSLTVNGGVPAQCDLPSFKVTTDPSYREF